MARYMVERNYVQVFGRIWMPMVEAALEIPLDRYDVENIKEHGDGELTREAVEQWLTTHSGDFSTVIDFNASIGDWESGWKDEENEIKYSDAMHGVEEEA